MAKTLYDLALEYLNQGMPDITQAPGTTTPTPTPTPTPVTPQNPNAPTLPSGGGGGGGGNNVYNSNSNSNYLTRPYQNAINDSLLGTPDYQGAEQTSGLESLMGKIPGMTMLANAIGSKLPVNQTAILNNELIGAGMQLNDIGQFVSDGGAAYKEDGSNIMAGYNASKVTQETFDKRRDVIEKNMKDPKQKAAKLAALDAAEASFFGAKAKADMVFDNKSLAKNPDYISQKIINQKMKEALEGEDDSDEDIDSFDPLNQIDSMPSFAGMNAPSAFTLTAPQYGASFGQGYGSGYGGSTYDEAGIGPGYGGGSTYDEAGVGPAGQGSITNPSNYGTGSGNLGDYQMQPSKPTQSGPTYSGMGSIGSGGGGGNNDSSGKSIVCTAMYQTTGLEDWSKAMKIWYIYQKKYLTIQHQEGYHKLFKPFVTGMHKNNLIKAIGAHVAKHRTQHLKHVMFNSKPSLLGRIYNKILEPICYFVGKHG